MRNRNLSLLMISARKPQWDRASRAMTKCPSPLHGDTEFNLYGKRSSGKMRWTSGGKSCQWLGIQPCLPALGCLLDPTSSQTAGPRPTLVRIHQIPKPLDGHTITPLLSAGVWSQPRPWAKADFWPYRNSLLSGHCFPSLLARPISQTNEWSKSSGVCSSPAPRTHFYPWSAAHFKRSCYQLPEVVFPNPHHLGETCHCPSVKGDSHFCAKFSLSILCFFTSPLLFSKVVMSFPPFNH